MDLHKMLVHDVSSNTHWGSSMDVEDDHSESDKLSNEDEKVDGREGNGDSDTVQ